MQPSVAANGSHAPAASAAKQNGTQKEKAGKGKAEKKAKKEPAEPAAVSTKVPPPPPPFPPSPVPVTVVLGMTGWCFSATSQSQIMTHHVIRGGLDSPANEDPAFR